MVTRPLTRTLLTGGIDALFVLFLAFTPPALAAPSSAGSGTPFLQLVLLLIAILAAGLSALFWRLLVVRREHYTLKHFLIASLLTVVLFFPLAWAIRLYGEFLFHGSVTGIGVLQPTKLAGITGELLTLTLLSYCTSGLFMLMFSTAAKMVLTKLLPDERYS